MQERQDQQKETEEDIDSEEEVEEEYSRTTLYFQKPTKRSYKRWMNKMELKYDIVFDSKKRLLHEALINVAMDNEDEFIETLEELHTPETQTSEKP